MHIKHPKPTEISRLAAEFIGTYMLVLVVCMNKVTMFLPGDVADALGIFGPFAVACVLMVLIYSLGSISGAHFNPAVTVTCYLQEAIEFTEGIKYIVFQCAGGALAGLTTVLIHGSDKTGTVSNGPLDSVTFVIGAPLVEFLYTFMLCFTVLNVAVADATKGNKFYGVAIGFVVIAGGYGGGTVSGGFFNPAIVLGANLMSLSWSSTFFAPIYAACHLAAAIVAPVALHIVRPETKLPEKHVNAVTKVFYKIEAMFDSEDTAEFIGAMFLTLSLSLNRIISSMSAKNLDDLNLPTSGNPGASLSVGAALMCMIFAMGDVSGGIFNPAVTIAYLGRFHGTGCGVGKEKLQDMQTSPKEGIKYFLAQCLGSLAGTGLTILIWLAQAPTGSISPVQPAFAGVNQTTLEGDQQHTLGQAFFSETFGTFLYCFVVLCVATTFVPLKEYKAFAIGCTFVAVGYAFGPLSGGLLNPAVTIADGVVTLGVLNHPEIILTYVGAQLFGGVLAAAVFRFVTHQHEMELEGQPEGYERIGAPAGYDKLEGGKPMTG